MTNPSYKLFIMYAHEDKRIHDKLLIHFSPLINEGCLQVWSDHEIKPSSIWDDEIKQKLHEADIVLMLISADFFASEYIRKTELQIAKERHLKNEVRLIPIIVRECAWQQVTDISHLQVLPPNGIPVVKSGAWKSKDEPYHEVIKGVLSLINALKSVEKKLSTKINHRSNQFLPHRKITKRIYWYVAFDILLLFAIMMSLYIHRTPIKSEVAILTKTPVVFTKDTNDIIKKPPKKVPKQISQKAETNIEPKLSNSVQEILPNQVLIKHPDGVFYPDIKINPSSKQTQIMRFITKVSVLPQQEYVVTIKDQQGRMWQANFNGSEVEVSEKRLTLINTSNEN